MKSLLFIILLFSSSVVFAGSADAILTCKSASGRTVFRAKIGDLLSFTSATFAIDGESLIYNDYSKGQVVFNAKHKVFTISINDPKVGWLTFYAIPASFKTITNQRFNQHYKFKAVIQGKDPRQGKYQSKEITLNCELTYSI